MSDPSFGLILKLDSSSIPTSAVVPIVQFTHITSRHDFSKADLVIIHQTSLNDAVHDGIIRNLGAVSLGDSASAEVRNYTTFDGWYDFCSPLIRSGCIY
jgi:hypothetical protein